MLLPRISKILAEREDAIEGGLNRADEAQAEAQRVLEQYRAQLEDARHEAARLRSEATEQGAQIIAEMRERATAEARRITDSAQAQIEAERQAALQSLRSEVGALSVELASRIVGESLTDTARQGRMVDRFLEEIEARDGAGAPAGSGATGAGAGQ
jgi:F-type H+-transporting ATPase subunit b